MAAEGRAVASGTRSVAVAGDVVDSVIVTGDHARVELQLGPESGALLELLRKSQFPVKRLRPLPLDDRPAAFPDHVDRETETAQLLEASGQAGSANVHGQAGIGKTYLLRRAAHEAAAGALPDGVTYVFAKGKTDDDLLQELFEAFYDCKPPYRAAASEIRADLRSRRSLVIVDSLELERDEAQAFVASAPSCRFLVASRERLLWEGESFVLAGLAEPDALAVLVAELGRPVADDEQAAAVEICRRTGGNPLSIRQAASLAREHGRPLPTIADTFSADEPAAHAQLSDRERELLAMLAAVPGVAVGEERLRETAGPGATSSLERLERLRLITSHSPRYSLQGDPEHAALAAAEIERGGDRLLRGFVAWAERARTDFRELLHEADAIVAVVRWAMRHDRDAEALRLARAADAAFAWARRFGAWGELVDAALHAARRTGDRQGEAWALHQHGTRAFALGDRTAAIASLKAALAIRRELRNDSGARATQHNLKLVSRPAWYLRLVTHAPVTALVIAVAAVALVLAGGGGAATWLLTRGHNHATAMLTVRREGSGAGSISVRGADCSHQCSSSLAVGSRVRLAENPGKASVFDHWTGVVCDEGQTSTSCTFVLAADVTVTAVFAATPTNYTLQVAVSGPGAGSIVGTLDCSGSCEKTLAAGSRVSLTARAGKASTFDHWTDVTCEEGQLSTTCTFTVNADTTVKAVFAAPSGQGYTLNVSVSGAGSIQGTLACSGNCRKTLPAKSHVTLTALAANGSTFQRWTGVTCDGGPTAPTCTFELTANVTATAVFAQAPHRKYTLTASVSGNGSVLGTLPCSMTCRKALPAGTRVTLTARADNGSTFDQWDDVTCDQGPANPTCTFALSADTTATALFAVTSPGQFSLTVSVAGKGKGEILGTLDCLVSCQQSFDAGTQVTLTAHAEQGYAFDQWTGVTCDEEQTSTVCSFLLASDVTAAAVFAPAVSLSVKHSSGGTIASAPAGIDCGDTCSAPFALGSKVTLTATASEGYHFAYWKFPGCPKTNTCAIVMDRSHAVYAKFAEDTG